MRDPSRSPDRRADALALALAPGIGPRGYRDRVAAFGSAPHAFAATVSAGERPHLLAMAERMYDDAVRCGARLILLEDELYPPALHDLYDPPPFLFAVGDLAALARPVVAVVGTRRATPYGERAATAIARALALAGVCVASGMARGIDAAAHRSALAARGFTVGVLGTGVDVAYPAAHSALHRAVARHGLLLSEFPCGTRAAPGSFPRRNRIIAALARATVVVEAGEGSGALITADFASDLHREVGVVPGPIDSPQSTRSNALLREAAHPILGAEDALALAGIARGTARYAAPTLTGDEQLVWSALHDGLTDGDAIGGRTGLGPRRTMAAVTALELAGLVETTPTGELRARAPLPERQK